MCAGRVVHGSNVIASDRPTVSERVRAGVMESSIGRGHPRSHPYGCWESDWLLEWRHREATSARAN